ncbi:hypothetical protein ABID29_001022 [Streptococcus rupicaprae]|uniref:DUF4176 domain-containing protein n=1 Tax=Streptococcus rupicaprae TaxID=759619 RepID=A0ABV2FH82_9STRE
MKLLPLGSVVYLKEGRIPLMLVMRRPVVNLLNGTYYFDYAAVDQIIGLEPDRAVYFNHEDISEIVFEGYISDKENRIQEAMQEWIISHPEIKKGKISQEKV